MATNDREITPTNLIEPHEAFKEYLTPSRSNIQGVIAYNKAHNPTATKQSVFDFFRVKRRSDYNILNGPTIRRPPGVKEGRKSGRKKKLSKEDIERIEGIINDGDIRHRAIS